MRWVGIKGKSCLDSVDNFNVRRSTWVLSSGVKQKSEQRRLHALLQLLTYASGSAIISNQDFAYSYYVYWINDTVHVLSI